MTEWRASAHDAADRGSERDKFVKLLREAQGNVMCSLELRDLGLLKIPTEVVRLSELTALDLSVSRSRHRERERLA